MTEIKATEGSEKKSLNFIEQIVEKDLKEGKNDGRIQTRFPPEPNGYLGRCGICRSYQRRHPVVRIPVG